MTASASFPGSVISHLRLPLAAALLPASVAWGQTVPPPKPADPAAKTAPTVLSIFEVRADKDEGYRSTHTTSAFNALTTLRNTPGSISVMNRELMDDLNVVDVAELSKFAITGEVGTATEGQSGAMSGGGAHVFRGLTSGIQLRNGVSFQAPVDAYALERVELLRGPSAFLNGEGAPGGMLNSISKQPQFTGNFEKLNLLIGSYDFYRAEFDVNRRLNDKFGVRAVIAYHNEESFRNHASRDFKAGYLAAHYRPYVHTNFRVNIETTRNFSRQLGAILSDGYTISDRNGSFTTLTATTGGPTYIPATGAFYDSTGLRRSVGTNILLNYLPATNVMPRKMNLSGRNATFDIVTKTVGIEAMQRVTEDFNVRLDIALRDTFRNGRNRNGSGSGRLMRDLDPTLPNGTPNPYFRELYTEYYFFEVRDSEPRVNFRLSGVYDLKFPFMTQRVLVMGSHSTTNPGQQSTEFLPPSNVVDRASGFFKGAAFNPANTAAAYVANNAIMAQNYFRRRFYLRDGDRNSITANTLVTGLERQEIDGNLQGASIAGNRIFRIKSFGGGMSGSYFKERLSTMVGWRIDGVDQEIHRDFYNYVTRQRFTDPTFVPPATDISKYDINKQSSINYGAVFTPIPLVSVYYNYAQSVAISSGIGAGTKFDNTIRGVPTGDGDEFGLRWSLFDGRLESNWTRYRTYMLRTSITASLPARTELFGIFPTANLNGSDTQATKAQGYEFETVANLTKNWRLIWNYASNDLELSQRLPITKAFRDAAKAKNAPTPETDAYLLTVPDGVPVTGFTKVRTNLVTNYRFTSGPLRNLSIGGGAQYRQKSYLGNFDLNLDGVAEQLFTPPYWLGNLSLGYRTRVWNRPVDLGLGISNVTNKNYYRAFALGAGNWGDPRTFRLSIRTDL
jgi:outer membrane receptor protein involved in Fe transport